MLICPTVFLETRMHSCAWKVQQNGHKRHAAIPSLEQRREREFIGTNIKQFHAKFNIGTGTPKKTCKTGCLVGRPSKVS